MTPVAHSRKNVGLGRAPERSNHVSLALRRDAAAGIRLFNRAEVRL
jgi:hypothetical protein